MGIVGGGDRHYRGRGLAETAVGGAVEWTCPACKNLNLSPIAGGCLTCGVGTPQEAELAAAQRPDGAIPADQIAQYLFGLAGATGQDLRAWAGCLREPAQLTLCRALAHYAETGGIGPGEMTRREIVSWGRAVMPPDAPQDAGPGAVSP
jgi:hypothetical protein